MSAEEGEGGKDEQEEAAENNWTKLQREKVVQEEKEVLGYKPLFCHGIPRAKLCQAAETVKQVLGILDSLCSLAVSDDHLE